jgi:hypothetical protein
MRLLLVLLTAFTSTLSFGQVPLDNYTTDTIRLPEFKAKKIVAYKLQQVTIYVNYKDFYKEFLPLYNRYKDGVKGIEKERRQGHYINPDYEPRFRILDTTIQQLKAQIKTADTVFLTQTTFDKYQLRELIDFDKHIENGTCAITDNKGKRHYLIIRQKGSWYRGPLAAWGGRRYFLPGRTSFFLSGTDWIS